MSPFRPDLVDVWIFRLAATATGEPTTNGQATNNERAVPGVRPAPVPSEPATAIGLAGDPGAAAPGKGTEEAATSEESATVEGAVVGEAATSADQLEILLLRRSPGRILPGLWQCVSGSLEPGESITDGALRELAEETGFGPEQIEAFYDLDQVNQFHEPSYRAIVSSAVFVVRVRAGTEPILSHEHDAMRWVSSSDALDLAVWPAYRESIRRIAENLVDPARAIWFELTLSGDRARR